MICVDTRFIFSRCTKWPLLPWFMYELFEELSACCKSCLIASVMHQPFSAGMLFKYILFCLYMVWNNLVIEVSDVGQLGFHSQQRNTWIFFFFTTVQTRCKAYPTLYAKGTRMMKLELEADHFPPSSTDVKNACSCTFIPMSSWYSALITEISFPSSSVSRPMVIW